MSQLNFRDIFRLGFINTEAYHQIGDYLGFLGGFPDNTDGLVDIQQYFLQSLKQMELFLFLVQIKIGAAADTLDTESGPFLQNFTDPHHLWKTGNENIEITGKGVLQRGKAEQALHESVRFHTPFQVNGNFEPLQTGFVTDIANFLQFPLLDQLDDFFDDSFNGGCGRNLGDINAVGGFVVSVPGTDADTPPPGTVNGVQRGGIADDLAASGKIRSKKSGRNLMFGVFDQSNGGIANL